jgi:hypothetical protein
VKGFKYSNRITLKPALSIFTEGSFKRVYFPKVSNVTKDAITVTSLPDNLWYLGSIFS